MAFAAEHPFIIPTVTSNEPVLDRHQAPVAESFCLDREDDPWWASWKTAADLLQHLQGLLDADEDGTLAVREADMPEPITGLMHYIGGETIVIPHRLLTESLDVGGGGLLELIRSRHRPHLWVIDGTVRGGTLHSVLTSGDRERLGITSNLQRVKVPWRAVDLPPGRPGVLQAYEELTKGSRPDRRRSRAGKGVAWSGLTFMDEGPRRGERHRAWVFARTERGSGKPPEVVGTQAWSRPVRQLRLRELRGLEHARGVVVGAGSVGGHVALEMARAGFGRLDIVDHDDYDLNNGVRHVLQANEAGRSKAQAVAERAQASSPFTDAVGHDRDVGSSQEARRSVLEMVGAASVVIDATGSRNVTRLLHRRCAEAGVPLISGALSPGGRGARVLVLRGFRPCLDCFYSDASIPVPDSDPVANTTPYGCSHPAASCAPFDVSELASNIARCAVRCVPRLRYPRLDFDWAVMNFCRSENRWAQGLLEPQADCVACTS